MAFPTDIQAAEYFLVAYNNLATTLSQEASASDTTIYAASTDNFPSSGWATIEDEVFSYTGKTSGSFTGCGRGADNTTAAIHASGKAVSLTLPAIAHNRIVTEIRAALTKLGVDSSAVTTTHDYKLSGVTGTDKSVSKTGTETLTNKTLTSPTLSKPLVNASYDSAETYTPAAAGTATLDLALSNEHQITMPAGNITIAISNAAVGQKFIVSITQDSVGSRTVTWFTTIRWFDTAPTLTTTASKRDTFGFIVTGTNTYDGFIIGQGG